LQRTAGGQLVPWQTLAFNRVIPIESPPQYTEGKVSIPTAAAGALLHAVPYAGGGLFFVPGFQAGVAALMLEESAVGTAGAPNPPVSWSWNIRVGDAIQLNGGGPWYTVVGPMTIPPAPVTWDDDKTYANPEMFVNFGPPGWDFSGGKGSARQYSPLVRDGRPVEFLFLVNGRDDDKNGWVDEGFDGVDNNIANGVDEAAEWEVESWLGSAAAGVADAAYSIRRRPAAAANAREIALPTAMVIDATTALLSAERSRLPVNPYSGTVDILLAPDGTVIPSAIYASPASVGMDGMFLHFWLSSREDVADVPLQDDGAGNVTPAPLETVGGVPHYLPIARAAGTSASYSLPTLKGGYSLLTLFGRTGQVVVIDSPPFDDPVAAAAANRAYDVARPFEAVRRGAR
jgi:hypothetical protein